MTLRKTITASMTRGDSHFVAECVEIAVVTQALTIDETLANLEEAVSLYLEGEDLEALGFAPNPTVIVTLELQPSYA